MFNIDDLTYKQMKELSAVFNAGSKPENKHISARYLGKEVILRTYSAGNHFGILTAYDPQTSTAILSDARRLWKWNTDKGISLSEVATYGIVQSNSKICTTLPEQMVGEVIEILPVTFEAAGSIKSAAVYTP